MVLGLSVRVALCCALALVFPGIFLGWLLARVQFRRRIILDVLIHAPMVVPPVVTGYLLLVLFGRRGMVGAWLLRNFGVTLAFTWHAAVLASAIMALPLMVRAVRLSIEQVDPRLESVARTLGAGHLRVFATVTLPLAMPGILTGFVLAFARSLGEFGATIVFAGNILGETRTLPLAIYTHLQTPGGEAAALRLAGISLGLALAALVLSEWLTRRSQRWMGTSGLR